MKRLILTGWYGGSELARAGLAEIVVPFDFQLLDGLARCSVPAVSGLEEGPFSLDMHNDALRHARYKRSRLSLTDLGKAVLGGDQNFRRHNRIDRWWGGTHLTSERLWRWDRESHSLVAP